MSVRRLLSTIVLIATFEMVTTGSAFGATGTQPIITLSVAPSSGHPGTAVGVRGTQCGGSPTVMFQTPSVVQAGTGNGIAVPVSYSAGTQSFRGTFTIPTSSSTGSALVLVTCDRSAGTTASFTVTGSSASSSTTAAPTTTGHTTTTPSTSGSSSSTGSGSQVSRIPSGPAQTGGGSAAGGPNLALAMGGGSVMLAGGAMVALAYRRRSAEAAS